MGYSLHKTTKVFRKFGADLINSPSSTHLLNFDLSLVGIADLGTHTEVINTKYWKITGDPEVVSIMSQAEKDTLDADLASAKLDALRAEYKASMDTNKRFKAFAKILLDEINILRGEHNLPLRTIQQLKTAIRDEIDVQ